MKIIRVFPAGLKRRGSSMLPCDAYAFIGDPPFIRPDADEVHISTTFTWDIPEAKRLQLAWSQYYSVVKLGGVAFDDLCEGFIPGMYIRQGITFTSRGCNFQCPWCEVWRREGKLRELPTIYEGNIVQDNNLLQCSNQHIEKVLAMLKSQHGVEFKGGLDSRLMTDAIAGGIRSLSVKQVFFAADTKEAIKPLQKAIKILGLPRDRVRCYVLLKFNPAESLPDARERMQLVWEAGAMPFAQLYQPKEKWIEYPAEWKRFARIWQRPAIMKALMKQDGNGA